MKIVTPQARQPTESSFITLLLTQLIFPTLSSAYFGVFAVIIAKLFPRHIRSTGLSISYNITVMLFGGFAQFIITELITITGTPLAISYYLLAAILLSLIASLCYHDKRTAYEHSRLVNTPHCV